MRIDIELLRAVAGADTMIPGAGQLIPLICPLLKDHRSAVRSIPYY